MNEKNSAEQHAELIGSLAVMQELLVRVIKRELDNGTLKKGTVQSCLANFIGYKPTDDVIANHAASGAEATAQYISGAVGLGHYPDLDKMNVSLSWPAETMSVGV